MYLKAKKSLYVARAVNGVDTGGSQELLDVLVTVESVRVQASMTGVCTYRFALTGAGEQYIGGGDLSFQYTPYKDAFEQAYQALLVHDAFQSSELVI